MFEREIRARTASSAWVRPAAWRTDRRLSPNVTTMYRNRYIATAAGTLRIRTPGSLVKIFSDLGAELHSAHQARTASGRWLVSDGSSGDWTMARFSPRSSSPGATRSVLSADQTE